MQRSRVCLRIFGDDFMQPLSALHKILKARLPLLSRTARHIRQELKRLRAIFTRVSRENGWGDAESRSGSGSSLEQAATLRRELPEPTQGLLEFP
mgnify:CR=1 FL=1